jgi:hypothetical protein
MGMGFSNVDFVGIWILELFNSETAVRKPINNMTICRMPSKFEHIDHKTLIAKFPEPLNFSPLLLN